eukprot:7334022-Prymnesium_polylepis.1
MAYELLAKEVGRKGSLPWIDMPGVNGGARTVYQSSNPIPFPEMERIAIQCKMRLMEIELGVCAPPCFKTIDPWKMDPISIDRDGRFV